MYIFKENTYIPDINGFKRPKANDGLWLMLLLPAAIITSALAHPIVLTPTYKLSAALCVGLIGSSLASIYQQIKKDKKFNVLFNCIASVVCAGIFFLYLKKDYTFSVISALLATFFYQYQYLVVLKKFPRSFTLGEGALITQALVLFLYATGINLFCSNGKVYSSNMQISTLIIQLGLLGIGAIAFSTHYLRIQSTVTFYVTSILIIFVVILIPLHVLLKRSPLIWIINLMFYDMASIKMILYWIFCCGVAVLAVSNQIFNAQKATTSQRKVFHILAVSVYVPGLIFTCSFLYLSSGVILGVFLALEILRITKVPPIGNYLEDGFSVFSDEKDTGIVAFTAIYLLAGCSLPLWIHPAPCDVTDSGVFSLLPLLSGLLTIGIGDTAASVIGSNFGAHKWKSSPKSIEGSLACMLSQMIIVMLLMYLGWIRNVTTIQFIRILGAIITSSLVEAKTTQVDNLVLPLIMYIILI